LRRAKKTWGQKKPPNKRPSSHQQALSTHGIKGMNTSEIRESTSTRGRGKKIQDSKQHVGRAGSRYSCENCKLKREGGPPHGGSLMKIGGKIKLFKKRLRSAENVETRNHRHDGGDGRKMEHKRKIGWVDLAEIGKNTWVKGTLTS